MGGGPFVIHPFFKGEQQTGNAVFLETVCVSKSLPFQKNSGLRQHFVKTVQPFLRISVAALETKALSLIF